MKNTLRPLRQRLEEARHNTHVPLNILEQDYLLSWVLYGIGMVAGLRENLAFKGGTALKKCYFGAYRFSEDLDFSFVGRTQAPETIMAHLQHACRIAVDAMTAHMPTPKILIEKYTEKEPHPEGQLAYTIRAQLPWHREPIVKVMVEITISEAVVLPLVTKPLLHHYGETLDATLLVYSLEEIIAEKLRAILQYTKKLHEHSWARSRVRDYYDLWNIFHSFDVMLDYGLIKNTLERKCAAKHIDFTCIDDFFQPITMAEIHKTWAIWLNPLVTTLPEVHAVMADIRHTLARFL